MIYKTLDNDWLEFSLEVIVVFFSKDTYLIQKPTTSLITDKEQYLNQSQFAVYLSENGLKYDRAKINMYLKRGKLPEPTLIIAGMKYWEKSVCEAYLHSQMNN
ncbi:hypothetical protein CIL03_08745 [Virgibacillus indicus]|uniref:Uncharacterized protein n=1 Tax=Virgibacillus indicus TaxID=2024554 RepID=A0A265NB99_9BACI|nr:hypothetical protein [Virgibacillus indicus]OZU89091.1 hypothetical protein CIL03_08745 [Virgibacillus indicus]